MRSTKEDTVAAAELLGLPWAHGLEKPWAVTTCGILEEGRHGPPGWRTTCGSDEAGADALARHPQVHAHGLHGGLCIREVGQAAAVRALLVARQAEALHLGVDVPAVAQARTSSATWTPAPP